MLRCYGLDSQGRVHSLPALCRLRILQSADVPADSLRLLFYGVYEEEFCRIYVYSQEELIFTAEVDEQIEKAGDISTTELICRSTAAVLLDNEAKPGNFVNPSCELVFRTYAAPFGFTRYYGNNKCLQGEFSVPKGVSCYEVLENFSKVMFGKSPKVKGDEVYFEGDAEARELIFSDDGKGLPFTDFTYNRLRCRRISKIYVKLKDGEDYLTCVCDDDAVEKGIQRQRYMDVSSATRETLADVHTALNTSRAKAEEISLLYPGKLTDVISASARVSVQGKLYEGFVVKNLDYTCGKDREYTRITLRRKENSDVDNFLSG